jgi:hypothetical protein
MDSKEKNKYQKSNKENVKQQKSNKYRNNQDKQNKPNYTKKYNMEYSDKLKAAAVD